MTKSVIPNIRQIADVHMFPISKLLIQKVIRGEIQRILILN